MVTSRPSPAPAPGWFAVLVLDPLTDRLARLPRPRNPVAPALPLVPSPAGLARWGLVDGVLAAACFSVRGLNVALPQLALAGAALFFVALLLHRRAELRDGGPGVEAAVQVRDLCCTLGMAGGQFGLGHRIGPLYFGLAMVLLSLLYGANARQSGHTWGALRERAMRDGERRALELAGPRLSAEEREYAEHVLSACLDGPPGLLNHRTRRGERPAPISRTEVSLAVFVLGPLAGLTVWPGRDGFTGIVELTIPAALLLLVAEGVAAVRLWRLTREAAVVLAELERAAAEPVTVPAARAEAAPVGLSLLGGPR